MLILSSSELHQELPAWPRDHRQMDVPNFSSVAALALVRRVRRCLHEWYGAKWPIARGCDGVKIARGRKRGRARASCPAGVVESFLKEIKSVLTWKFGAEEVEHSREQPMYLEQRTAGREPTRAANPRIADVFDFSHA